MNAQKYVDFGMEQRFLAQSFIIMDERSKIFNLWLN